MTLAEVERLVSSGTLVVIIPEKCHPFVDEQEIGPLIRQHVNGLKATPVRVIYLNPDTSRFDAPSPRTGSHF